MGFCSRSESCCCGCSVRSGTLMLLYWELLNFAVSTFFCTVMYMQENISPSLAAFGLFCNALVLLIVLAGFYGLAQKKPALILPFFIYRIVIAIVISVGMILLLFVENYGLQTMNNNFNAKSVKMYDDNGTAGTAIRNVQEGIIILMIVELITAVLEIHFAKVVYSCYSELEQGLNQQSAVILGVLQRPMAPYPPYISLPSEPTNIYSHNSSNVTRLTNFHSNDPTVDGGDTVKLL